MMNSSWKKWAVAALLALSVSVVQAMSLSQAVDQVKRQTGGKVLSAKTEIRGDREMHIIKVITEDGRVKTVRVRGDRVRNSKEKRPDARFGY